MNPSDSIPLSADRRYECLGCAFNLTGIVPVAGVITCPECGKTGPVGDVAEPQPPPLPGWWVIYRSRCFPSAVVSFAIAAGLLLSFITGWILLGVVIALLVILDFIATVSVPISSAFDLAEAHIRVRHRAKFILVASVTGIVLNILQIIAMIVVFSFLMSMLLDRRY